MKSEDIHLKTDAALNALMADLAKGKSESLTNYLKVMGKFSSYSLSNQMLRATPKNPMTAKNHRTRAGQCNDWKQPQA